MPVISRAILVYNHRRREYPADGIVITRSHTPLADGRGVQVQTHERRPCRARVTRWVEERANKLLRNSNASVRRLPIEKPIKSGTTHEQDLAMPYARDL